MTPSGGILMAPGLAPVPRRVLLALAALCLAWFVLCCVATTRAALPPVPEFPLPVDQQHSTTVRQLAKPVLESHLLDDMKSPTNWHLFGPGEMTFTTERKRDGRQSLRLTSPTKGTEPPPTAGRPWAETGVRREFNNEDWSGFNRLSVWVYPDLPGFKIVSLKLTLDCEGAAGRSYTDGGMNFVLLRNHEWNQVIWEITHLDRKHVKAVELIYRLQGNEPGATNRVCYDFDHLELQRVAPDYFRGWGVAPGEIAYCHVGYRPDDPKLAFAAPSAETRFELINTVSGRQVWTGKTRVVEGPGGGIQVLDFSAFNQPGSYRLRAGRIESEPFRIQSDPWRDTLIAGLNFFYCERCGFAVPGVHDVCHQDERAEHAGRSLIINGGWHDAGDLSQGLVNTSEAAWSMLRLAERMEKSDPELARRFRDEARWGVEWMLKTRFGDGFRVNWITMDFWTDGILGDADDVVVKGENSPFENFLAAAVEAAAARAYAQSDPALAERCRAAAEADYGFAVARTNNPNLELAGAAAQSSIELWRTTKAEKYAAKAVDFADFLMSCQQVEKPNWDKPLTGFFYSSPQHNRISHYFHRSHEQAPIIALADLAAFFPDHPKASSWRASVKRYGDYLLAVAAINAPYQMCSAGIYRLLENPSAADRKQIEQGVRLAEGVYLRRFPVWGDFRGNLGVLLSQATAAATAAHLLDSPELRELARQQAEWTLGRNPFNSSLMYGVGHNYNPQYTAMSGDITGSLPVGIQTRLEEDTPYWPDSNCYNYAEVWVHPVSRWFLLQAELADN